MSARRTLAMAQRVVHQVVQVLAPGCVPLFLTDGLKDYGTALLTHFGHWMQPARRQDKGPMPKPRWMPLPELLYAQVVKSYRRRRIVGVKHRVVFGTSWSECSRSWRRVAGRSIRPLWSGSTWTSASAWRRSGVGSTRCARAKTACGISWRCSRPTTISCLPHASLRQPLLVPEATNGRGSAKVWRPCTPAMAAGLTDHVWSLQRGVALSGAAVAPAADGLRNGTG